MMDDDDEGGQRAQHHIEEYVPMDLVFYLHTSTFKRGCLALFGRDCLYCFLGGKAFAERYHGSFVLR